METKKIGSNTKCSLDTGTGGGEQELFWKRTLQITSTIVDPILCIFFSGFALIDPSTGSCPAGRSLTEAECQAAGEFGSAWGGSGTWGLPETCGCFVDQDGKRYFNKLTGACDKPDAGEKMICKKPGTSLFSPPERAEGGGGDAWCLDAATLCPGCFAMGLLCSLHVPVIHVKPHSCTHATFDTQLLESMRHFVQRVLRNLAMLPDLRLCHQCPCSAAGA